MPKARQFLQLEFKSGDVVAKVFHIEEWFTMSKVARSTWLRATLNLIEWVEWLPPALILQVVSRRSASPTKGCGCSPHAERPSLQACLNNI